MTATAGCISLGISAASLNAGSGTPCPEVPSTRASRTANSPRGTVPAGLNLSVLSLKIPLAARRSMARCAGMPTISVKMAPQAGTTAITANARIPHPHRRRVRFVRVIIDLPYSSSAVGNNRWLRLLFSVPLGSSEDWPSYQVGTAPGDRRLMDPGYVRGIANRASEPGGSEFPAYTPSGIPTAPRLSGGFLYPARNPCRCPCLPSALYLILIVLRLPEPTSARGRGCPAGPARSASRRQPRPRVARGCGAAH